MGSELARAGAGGIVLAVMGVVWLLVAIVHILLAIAVGTDNPPRRVLVGNGVWAIATLLTGIAGAAVYYVLHHGLLIRQVGDPLSPSSPPSY